MMTLSATGDPCQYQYWVPDLLPIPKDEEVWVLQDPPLHLHNISLLPQCSTNHTVVADIEKFPF